MGDVGSLEWLEAKVFGRSRAMIGSRLRSLPISREYVRRDI